MKSKNLMKLLGDYNQLSKVNENVEIEFLTPQDANSIKGGLTGTALCPCKKGVYTVTCSNVYSDAA